MPDLALYLLGSPRLERDGKAVEIDTRKALAMLAYLGVTGESPRRESLAALLWPDYDQTHAMGALRRTLSAIRVALAEECLEISRGVVSLASSVCVWCDVVEFQTKIALARQHAHRPGELCPTCLKSLEAAASLYRDVFMAGFTLRDSVVFDEWQFNQAETLRSDLAYALEKLALEYSLRQEYPEAQRHARRLLSLERLREDVHQLLMKVYAWSGQRNLALRQYRECVRILDQELGVEPLDETTELYLSILENRLAPLAGAMVKTLPEPALSRPAETPPARPGEINIPLIGRTWELDALLSAYQSSRNRGFFFVLEGEAGIGKTRLAHEFLTIVADRGAKTLVAQCYEGEAHLAYSPFIEALRSLFSREGSNRAMSQLPPHWLSEAARLLPELAAYAPVNSPPVMLEAPGAQGRLFESLRQIILTVCAGAYPGALFLDDLHWSDEASLDLLTYLVRRLQGAPLFILASWRTPDIAAGHRLQNLLAEAKRAGTGAQLSLARLTDLDVRSLLNAASANGLSVPAEMEKSFFKETEGLPFFIVEYLLGLAQESNNRQTGSWVLPESVRALIRARLSAVDETSRQLLAAAAALGRSFDLVTLRLASGRSDLETVSGLEALMSLGLVEERKPGLELSEPTYDFTHDKLREVVYEETSLARRRLLHRRAAEALLAEARNPAEREALAGQIAHHYQLAGQDNPASEYYRLAGEHDRKLSANAEALGHFQMALALNHPEPGALNEAMGDLRVLSGEYQAAIRSFETAAALGDASQLPRIERKLADIFQRLGDWELAEGHYQSALAALDEADELSECSRLYADWSLLAHRQADTDQALHLANLALEYAVPADDRRALAQANNLLGILARSRGEYDQACGYLEQSLAVAKGLDDPGALAAAQNNLALVYANLGNLDQAIELAEEALEICTRLGDRHRQAAMLNNLADFTHAAGRTEQAMDYLKKAVIIFAEIGEEHGARTSEIWKLSFW